LKDYKFKHLGQNLFLHPHRAVFWEEQELLLIADLHLGKASHFRKSGIPVPELVHNDDFDRMETLLLHYQPQKVVFLGDLFHSGYNKSWQRFTRFVRSQKDIDFVLIVGNHDIMDMEQYTGMMVVDKMRIAPYLLTHKPMSQGKHAQFYNISGHVHPAIKIRAHARQSFRVPCFYFSKDYCILPAFGNFTGTGQLTDVRNSDEIFIVADHEVLPLNGFVH
jgi:DNA ligase-associated metallophosphoesterase